MSEIIYLDLYKHAVPFQNWQTSLILNTLIFWHFSHQLMAHIRCSQTSFTYNSLGHRLSKGTLISVSAKPYWFWAESLCWSLRILWTWVLLAHSWRFKLFQVCLPLLSCLGIVLWVESTLCVTVECLQCLSVNWKLRIHSFTGWAVSHLYHLLVQYFNQEMLGCFENRGILHSCLELYWYLRSNSRITHLLGKTEGLGLPISEWNILPKWFSNLLFIHTVSCCCC